ncbi:hypothetical protein DFH08DRAFT_813922 [Mycena albidolilacea]|uniref:Uncharacterized protein n=1 Tax=Mycena albidolilacea TaxID=1033008 RepID=A0AAD6ZR41_9AGAR|nr:hypothetical protein DFH08DRAFT_813922 [Mycena albidolilacea]
MRHLLPTSPHSRSALSLSTLSHPSPAAPVRILRHPVLVTHPSPTHPTLCAAPSSSCAPGRSTGGGRSCHMIDGVNGKIAGVSLDEYTGRKLGVVAPTLEAACGLGMSLKGNAGTCQVPCNGIGRAQPWKAVYIFPTELGKS